MNVATQKPRITMYRAPENMLDSPVHMVDYAMHEFGPHQAEYLAGHDAIRAAIDGMPEKPTEAEAAAVKAALQEISSYPPFRAAHEKAVWAARTLVTHRRELIRRTDQPRTDAFINERAAKYGVTTLPTHFGTTGLLGGTK